jgi:YidC/Oxa1 family membrane protein insertase
MAVAMIFSTKLSNTNMDNSNPQAKTMQIMMYIMPLMMIVWFNSYSAGLSYYYFLSTLIGIIQTLLIRRFIDEEKVLSQLKEKIKNNKAPEKSNFQKRLEDLQKQRAMGNNPQKPNTTNIKYKKK